MTNQQNVVVLDVKSRGVRNVLPPSSLPVAESFSPLDLKMLLVKRFETEKGAKINAWVDSMRASSPTRIKSTASLPETDEKSSWIVRSISPSIFITSRFFNWCCYIVVISINDFFFCVFLKQVHHPSALSMFEQIVAASIGKQIVMFLDYDGTLSPIVEDPEKAFMPTEVCSYSTTVDQLPQSNSNSYWFILFGKTSLSLIRWEQL